MEKERLRSLVHDLVAHRLDMQREEKRRQVPASESPSKQPSIITREDVDQITFGGVLRIPRGAIVTALARELAAEKEILVSQEGRQEKTIALGADHGGFEMKEQVKNYVKRLGYQVKDLGTYDTGAVDYPDFALAVAMCVARKECEVGIIVDGAGIGSCIAANKVPGVRAAQCYDEVTASNSREHNFANVLTLGGRLISEERMQAIVKTWLETPYGAERHARRVRKISEIEAKYVRNAERGVGSGEKD